MAADAVHWAAHNDRREVDVSRSTVKTIWEARSCRGIADRFLARTGYESQFAEVPYDDDRPDNLFSPVAGDPGAHGEFDDESLARSLQLELTGSRAGRPDARRRGRRGVT